MILYREDFLHIDLTNYWVRFQENPILFYNYYHYGAIRFWLDPTSRMVPPYDLHIELMWGDPS